jgi:hypothetical protein
MDNVFGFMVLQHPSRLECSCPTDPTLVQYILTRRQPIEALFQR